MPMKQDKKSVVPEPAAAPVPEKLSGGVLFELDYLAVSGRKIQFEALRDVLARQKFKLDAVFFCQHCLNAGPDHYLPLVIEQGDLKKVTVENLLEEYRAAVAKEWKGASIRLQPALEKLLKVAAARQMRLGAVTEWPLEMAQPLFDHLQLQALGVTLYSLPELGSPCPRADVWLKITRALGRRPRHCIAVTTSMVACKSALAADCKCVVVPDEFTAFQDFGGVDMILDKLDDLKPEALLDLVESR